MPHHLAPPRARGDDARVVAAGLLMIAAQLGVRAWGVYGSWFQFDDFSFMSRVMNSRMGAHLLMTDYAGHLMPGGLFLTWLNLRISPLDFAIPASELLALQAASDLGALVFLVSAFGRRPGILAPLAIFLFTVISLPALMWWAAGVNQLPFLAALFWGSWAHLGYLRTRRFGYALLTMLVTLLALAFYEKTLLIFIVYAFLALSYFAQGDIIERLAHVGRRYAAGIALYSVVALGYLAVYVRYGLNFDPNRTNQEPLGPVFTNMVNSAYSTGVLGGPLRWEHTTELFAVADPTEIVVLVSLGLLGFLGYELAKTRARSKRAWLLIGYFLGADVLLVAGGRASFVGPVIALDYRYITEMAAVTAIALGLATLPLKGAVETVEPTRPSAFLNRPATIVSAVVVVSLLGLYSTSLYVQHWQSDRRSKTYFQTAQRELAAAKDPVPLVDVGVPGFLMWAFGFPENTSSHVLRMMAGDTYYPKIRSDSIYILADDGSVQPMVVNPVRRAVASPKSCPYRARRGSVTVPLDGPVIGGGWWVHVGYYADETTSMAVHAGDSRYQIQVRSGLHSLFFEANGDFDQVTFWDLDPEVNLCVTELQLGQPQPFSNPPVGSGT